jgi:hypothetical protein
MIATEQHIRMDVETAEEVADPTSAHYVARRRQGRLRWA